MKKTLTNIYYSFPCQLLVLHLRSNLVLLAVWILLGLFVTGGLALKYGLRYLFLSPEYLHKVGFWSFFYVGVGFGAFAMSWNLTTYLLGARYFPFLASLARPFTKFCLNNILLPAFFVILFLGNLIYFESQYELLSIGKIALHVFGFLTGILVFVLLVSAYFQMTNKDILNYVKYVKNLPPNLARNRPGRRNLPDFENIKANKNQWRVDTYLTAKFQSRLVRSVAHYDKSVLMRVFKQNHTNALVMQLLSLIVLVLLGIMIDNPAFRIPTGASIFLLGSIVVAFTGAVTYWFGKWRMMVLLLLAILINTVTKFDAFHHHNQAYGLNYNTENSVYDYANLENICKRENVETDIENTIQILNNWKTKATVSPDKKPKMVLYCVSGGGLKATTWSMQVLQQTDRLTNGKMMKNTVLMSGASGGMIGSAYFRELYLRQQQGEIKNLYDETYVDNVSKDLLNSISFTIVTNDLFVPWAKFQKNGYTYHKDRGYIFEKSLNENTNFVFNKTLEDYAAVEQNATIPMMFVTPSIVNDGRRMIISSQGVSYMMASPASLDIPASAEVDAIDFGRLFAEQDAYNMAFTTAIRMNATYPYVLPNVSLPTQPQIEVLDAGFRDNYGLKSAIRFIHVFEDWIQENTSGVVLVVVRAFDRDKAIESSENEGAIEAILNPLGIAGKILTLQDFEHDTNLGFIYDKLGKDKFEIVRFTYRPSNVMEDAPISFHITERQRRDILQAVEGEENRESMERLKELLE